MEHFHATSRGNQRNSQSGLTQNEQSEAVEQGTDVGQDPHQHSKLGKDKHDKSEFDVYVSERLPHVSFFASVSKKLK